jgi:RND superfamily putative drug exporter
MRQLGVGLTAAVLLDATVVRLVLLPAIIRLAGGACWWLPKPLGRLFGGERGAEEPPGPRADEPFPRFAAFAHRERERTEARSAAE